MSKVFIAMMFVLSTPWSQAKVMCGGKVEFSDTLSINMGGGKSKALKLNGVGLKKVMVFNIFYAGLYLENLSSNAAQILKSKEVKIGVVHSLRNIDKDQLVDMWDDEFSRLCNNQCEALRPVHERFLSYARSVKTGERLYLILFPDRFEFEISGHKGQETFPPIYSASYGTLLQRVLIGPDAEDKTLENGLLGKQTVCKKS